MAERQPSKLNVAGSTPVARFRGPSRGTSFVAAMARAARECGLLECAAPDPASLFALHEAVFARLRNARPSGASPFRSTPNAESLLSHAAEAWRAEGERADIGAAYERLLGIAPEASIGVRGGASARTTRGAFYTPWGVIDHLLDLALEPSLDEADASAQSPAARERALLAIRVCDPACGTGRFLLGAARRIARRVAAARADAGAANPVGRPSNHVPERVLEDVIRACVVGADIDPVAAALCRMNLSLACGARGPTPDDLAPRVGVCDAVLDPSPILAALGGPEARAHVVLGNPPFLNQLGVATTHPRERAAALRRRFGVAVGGYADGAGAFLLLGLSLIREGGRVAMIQPLSFLAATDARALRDEIADRGALEACWVCPTQAFDAGVLTCAPVIRAGKASAGAPRITVGELFRRVAPEVGASIVLAGRDSWSHILAHAMGAPRAEARPGAALIGDVARATADFRDQYYGLRGAIVEDDDLAGRDRSRFPRLITTAMLDPGRCAWGERPVRALGAAWRAPRVDLDALARDPEMASWARARLVPKVLLATQTKVLESWLDEAGDCLPLVPIITITAPTIGDLRRIVSALGSPRLTALAYRRRAGGALSAHAIRLSASDVLALPLEPADVETGPGLDEWWRGRTGEGATKTRSTAAAAALASRTKPQHAEP